jgi:hypothetical protein
MSASSIGSGFPNCNPEAGLSPASAVQSDGHYQSLARQCYWNVKRCLSGGHGTLFAKASTIAAALGVVKLIKAGLLAVGRDEIAAELRRPSRVLYPLPRADEDSDSKRAYRAWVWEAMQCPDLDVNFKLLWLILGERLRAAQLHRPRRPGRDRGNHGGDARGPRRGS